jgi:diguanylate cyclase (GGDEF)-like protein
MPEQEMMELHPTEEVKEAESTLEQLTEENERLKAEIAEKDRLMTIGGILAKHFESRATMLHEENAELQAKNKELEKIANMDVMTGIKNRRSFESEKRKAELQDNVSIMVIDADKFKPINDTLGHSAGDEVLKKIAEHIQGLLRSVVRSEDEVFRTGGDEFTVIFFGGDQDVLMQKFGNGLSFPMEYEGKTLNISLSTGIATRLPGEDIDETLKRADAATMQFKRQRGVERS